MSRRYLVTGGAGFIGSNFVRMLLEEEESATVTNLDLLTYAGVPATVAELDANPRHTFVQGDIADASLVDSLAADHDVIVNFAAESHVDRSIAGPAAFLHANVLGAGVLLDAARRHGVERFVQVSTDEVYGSISTGFAAEASPLLPSSPYSASKAAADLLVHSYDVTFGYQVITTRCTNNFGPYQFPEKVIPLFVTNLLDDKSVPLYGTGLNERDWIFVDDHNRAIRLLIDQGEPGGVYNIGADNQLTNLELTHRILAALGADETRIEYVADRAGHDLRYAVDSRKLRDLGWAPQHDFDENLVRTIDWYRQRRDWWGPLKGGKR